jgi:flagellar FliJ protein
MPGKDQGREEMKKFKFRLQKVLDVKEQVIRKTQRDLAFHENLKSQAESELTALQETLRAQSRKIETMHGESAADIQMEYDYFYQLLEAIKAQQQKIKQIEQKTAEIRNLLMEQQKERKILAKLKEKYQNSYLESVRKEEQILLDELAVIGSRS